MNTTIDKKLNLLEGFKNIIPMSMEGQILLDKHTSLRESDNKFPITGFTNFINEAIACNDGVLKNWALTTQKKIMESSINLWNFSLLLEKYEIENSTLYEKVIDELKYLKHYDTELFEGAINNGALENYVGYHEIREFNGFMNNIQYTRKINESTISFHPLSYFKLSGDDMIFMLENKAYKYNATKGLMETQISDEVFNQANTAIQSIPYNVDSDEYDMTFLVGDVNVSNKGKIFLDKQEIGLEEFQEQVKQSIVNVPEQVKMEESRKYDMLSSLVENWHRMLKFDNIHGFKNTETGKYKYLLEHENGYRYLIDEMGIKQTDSINEAINHINSEMGINISSLFENKLQQERSLMESVSKIDILIEQEIAKYDATISDIKEEMIFMTEGTEKWEEAENLIALCEEGKAALTLKK